MVLADLGRKINAALHSLSKATIINEEVRANAEADLRHWNCVIFTTIDFLFRSSTPC